MHYPDVQLLPDKACILHCRHPLIHPAAARYKLFIMHTSYTAPMCNYIGPIIRVMLAELTMKSLQEDGMSKARRAWTASLM